MYSCSISQSAHLVMADTGYQYTGAVVQQNFVCYIHHIYHYNTKVYLAICH